MKKNIGTTDKIIRLILAVLVGTLYLTNAISGTLAMILGLFAVIFIATSFMGFCPIYWGAKINTLKNKFSKNEN